MARGFAIMEGKINRVIDNNINIDNNNNIDNRQQWAWCGGPSLSLAGTSRANPIVVDSPNFPQNYPINVWLVSFDIILQAPECNSIKEI